MNVKSGVTVKAGVVVARAVWDGAYAAIAGVYCEDEDDRRQALADKIELAVMSQLGQVLDFYGGGGNADTD